MDDGDTGPRYRSQDEVVRLWSADDVAPSRESPNILIGGAPRSGTTLLQGLLCTDPRSNPLIGEVAPLRFLVEAYERSANHTRANVGSLYDEISQVQVAFEQIIGVWMADLRGRFQAQRLVLKEPELTKRIPSLLEASPDWLFVMITRDPRSTIASMIKWGSRLASDSNHAYARRDIAELAEHYNRFYRPILRCHDERFWANVVWIRYEDLVTEPERQLERLSRFTGLVCNPSETRSRVNFDELRRAENPAITPLYGQAISSASLQAHEELLTAEESADIAHRCRFLMRYFGYES